jgi:hypothetical protein
MTHAETVALLAEARSLLAGAAEQPDRQNAALLHQGAIARALLVIADVLLEGESTRLGH